MKTTLKNDVEDYNVKKINVLSLLNLPSGEGKPET
jgi:hypothetical protein